MAHQENLKLLMAEDNAVNRKLAQLLFKRHGFNLAFAEDGLEAVQMVGDKSYDLVLMDIEMPKLNGLDAAKKIKENLGDKSPPIVALTAHSLEGQREEFLAQGMDEYMTKPINIEDFKSILTKYL
jgi:CheY-like chemotaxis protein